MCFLFQDSPTNKLLYAKEIPEYKKRVQCYYQQIQEMPPLSEQEMNAHLAEESRVSEVFRESVCVLVIWLHKSLQLLCVFLNQLIRYKPSFHLIVFFFSCFYLILISV